MECCRDQRTQVSVFPFHLFVQGLLLFIVVCMIQTYGSLCCSQHFPCCAISQPYITIFKLAVLWLLLPFFTFSRKNWTSLKLYLASFGYNFTCNHHVQLKVTIRLTFRIPFLLKEKGNSRVGVCVCQILSQPLFLLWCFPHLKWNFSLSLVLFLPLFMWYLVVWLEYLCSKDTTEHI